MTGRMTSFTCDRAEFLGRDGSLAKPRGLGVDMLKEATGAGFDPCAAMQQQILVAPGETARVAIVLGSVKSPNDAAARDDIEAIHRRLQSFSKCQKAVRIFTDTWRRREHAVTIKTPNSQLDELVNSWLLFQALSCRFWGRSALYQSGGALGFRDQLQDTLALLHSEPALVRHHLLVCASRQFREGDVQHWWHFPSGRGVRTRISDDLAWLPFVVSAYVSATDDFGVLAEVVPYLDLKPLAPDQEDIYDLPQISDDRGTLFDHCLRALRRACTVGDSGLPLIGGGDWNDGMNRVGGENNRGQSVWMAWFLDVVLTQFAANVVAPLMADPPHDKAVAEVRSRLESLQRGGLNLAKEYRDLMDIADRYRAAAVTRAWDGDWFHRAYFADGTPLGSRNNRECQIDSIAQSWSAISLVNRAALGVDSQGAAGGLSAGGAARSPQSTADMSQLHRERSARAVDSAFERLVDRELGVVKLLTPPFDFETKFESKSGEVHRDPGYIRGYLPGVRENGAQYTHAAIWLAWACGIMGDGERAMNVLSLINPFNHSKTPEATAQYKVEPYVIAADVYTSQNHRGRGGWTWYTGSASWYYRTAVEVIMGVRKERGRWLIVDPCVPSTWAEFSITYRFSGTRYDIAVRNPDKVMRGVVSVTMDGQLLPDKRIPLETHTHSEEGRVTVHAVEVVMGKLPSGSG
jgi:cyclic beta-1,2-glucan synthetase